MQWLAAQVRRLHRQGDVAAERLFHRIGQQVIDDLREADEVRVDGHRVRWNRDVQFVLTSVNVGLHGRYRIRYDVLEESVGRVNRQFPGLYS